jgi:hypothetical protein
MIAGDGIEQGFWYLGHLLIDAGDQEHANYGAERKHEPAANSVSLLRDIGFAVLALLFCGTNNATGVFAVTCMLREGRLVRACEAPACRRSSSDPQADPHDRPA